MNNNLSNNLKKIRKDNNISQEKLAEDLGVSRQAISKWESGTAYPEMEKLIQIAEKFNLNIDDLLHKDVREVKKEEKSNKNINRYIDSFLNFITDTISLFTNMTFKSIAKCLFEQFIIGIVLLIVVLIIGSVGVILVQNVLNLFPQSLYNVLFGLFQSIYIVFALIMSLIIMIHIFKTRYLDYYKNYLNTSDESKDDAIVEEVHKDLGKEKTNSVIKLNNHDNKIVIRDPKHSEYKFINGLFKMIILCIKMIALFILLFLCIGLVSLFTLAVGSFVVVKTGILFIGLLLSFLSAAFIDIVIILLFLNFIFDRTNDKKKMIWSFIISLVLLGIGIGLIFIGGTTLKYVILNKDSENLKNNIIKFDMKDNLYILEDYCDTKVEYIEKDIKNVEVEIKTSLVTDVSYNYHYNGGIALVSYTSSPVEVFNYLVSNINDHNEIIEFSNEEYSIKVYASKSNIKKLKDNYKKNEKNNR